LFEEDKMRNKRVSPFAVLMSVGAAFLCSVSLPDGASAEAAGNSSVKSGGATAAATTTAAATSTMRRLDFRLEKASCASCILKVRKALRGAAGILKCEIALRKPYGAVVIYEPNKIKADKMQVIAREADPNKRVEFADLIDEPIKTIPTLLLPKHTTLRASP